MFGIIYFLLKLFASTSSKKISKNLRKPIFIGLIILALILAVGGKFLLSIPLTLLSLAIVKLKGFSIIQLIGLFRLIQTLRRSGRFSFNQSQNIQKELFKEIKGRIKLDDESLPFKDFDYEYWTKTTTKGNYSIKLRKKNWD
ncbi:hypothetical protein N9E96_00950 [Candidatus Pelagibacter sp.]|nr:hypothetical protein [Candidatus Pelagibacter sp.]